MNAYRYGQFSRNRYHQAEDARAQLTEYRGYPLLMPEIDDETLFDLEMNRLLLGPDPRVDRIIEDRNLANEIEKGLSEYPLPPINEEDIYGPINIGNELITGAPAGLYPHEVHTLIAGGTGSGKTTLITRLIKQYIAAKIPVFIFDYENEFPERLRGEDIIVIDGSNFKYNFLEVPPRVDPVLFLQEFCATFCDTEGLLIGSKGYLFSQIHYLYEQYGVFEGSNSFPSMLDLAEFLEAKKRRTKSNTREYSYLETCFNRTDTLRKALPNMLDCSTGMPLHILARGNVILLLNGLDFELQTLIVTLMLTRLCRYYIANGLRNNPGYRIGVFLDEGSRLYDRQQERRLYQGVPVISHLTATVRKYNLHLFVAVQQPSLLATSIIGNSSTKIQMQLGDARDNFDLGASMFLLEDQIRFSRFLSMGEAIVKLSSNRCPEPFVLTVPYDG